MRQRAFRGTLLATSSALALMVAIDQSVEAATCSVVTNPGLPYIQSGNTCVTFTTSPGTTGNITNTGTVTASGPSNPNGTGISLFLGPTVTGDIINQGTINANGFGVLMDQAKLNGSITNATGATLNATGAGGAGIQVQGTKAAIATEGVSGAITNNGTITSAGVGINVGDVTIGAGIANTSTITALTAIVVSEAMVTGNVSNGVTGQLTGNSTGALQVINGGTISGSVLNSGTITNNNVNGAGIYVFSSSGGIGPQTIAGSIVNETHASISGGYGIQVFATNNTGAITIGSGHPGNGVTNAGTITAGISGIVIGSATINGALTNSGTITAAVNGVQLFNLATAKNGTATFTFTGGAAKVTGGVTNSGTITSTGTGFAGVAISGATVTGGITNSTTGTITASNGVGILLGNTGRLAFSGGTVFTISGGGSTAVTGGVTNQGTITAKTGIKVTGGSTVDSITNSGTISGTTSAIDVTGEGAATIINQTAGTITGNILLSTFADTVNVSGGTIAGNIIGQGSSNTLNFTLGVGNTFTYGSAYGFSGINQVNINSGTAILDGTNSAASAAIVSGSTLQLGSGGASGSLTLTGTLVDNGTFAIDRSDTYTFASTISGAGSFVQMGSGTTVLSGANTYSGGTNINAGTLQVTNSTPGTSSSIGTGTLTFNGGTLQAGANNLTFANSVVLNAAGTIDTNGDNLTWSGAIGGGGALTVASTTTGGVLTLTNTNTYSGATTINSGTTLALTGTGSIASSSGVADGGTFDVSGVTGGGTSIMSLSGGGVVALGANTLTLSNASGTFSGGIGGTGGLTLTTGTETLTGTNGYNGVTTINGGTLALSGIGSIASSSSVADNGTFNISAVTGGGTSIMSLSGGGVVALGANTLTLSNASGTFSGGIGGTGGLTLTTGTETLTGTNGYNGVTTINGGTLALSGTGSIASSSNVADNGTFNIAGLTNGGTSIVSLSGSGIVTLGANTLTLSNASGTFSGGIGGTGGLTLTTGTETLTGTNGYGGVTTINGGTLALSGTGSIASSSNVADGGTLSIAGLTNGGTSIVSLSGSGTVTLGANTLTLSNASGTFSGGIGGTGGLTLTAGTETLTGTNGYSGTTTINGGTLQLGNGGTSGSIGSSTVTDNGVLAFDRSDSVAFGAVISGSGAVQQIGSGTTILTGTNVYTGGTTITGGTLQVGNGGTAGSIAGNVTDNGTLAFDRSDNVTFGNTISGSGGLTQLGSGTLILTGTNAYTGATSVDAGMLEVNGSIASSSLTTVTNGTTLFGTGTVGNTQINNGGIFAPGAMAAPGTSMTVQGNLAFQSGAIYFIQVNPTTSTSATVSGSATLTGGTVDAVFASGTYMTKTYDILHATSLGGTTFTTLSTINKPVDVTANLSYSNNTDVFLNLTAQLGNGASGLNPNQQAVANAIDAYFNNGGVLPPAFVNLLGLTGTNLANSLSQLEGQAATDADKGAFALMTEFLELMLDPFSNGGGSGGGSNGFAAEQQAEFPPDIALAYASVLKAPPPVPFQQRWTAWGSGFGGSNKTNGDPAAGTNDVSAQIYGFAAGMDYHFTPDTVAGFALAGGGTSWSLSQGLGGGRSDAFQAGIYGKTRSGPAYLAASLAFANNWMTTNRIALGDELTAKFNAQGYAGRLEAGYRYAVLPTVGITPYAALQAQEFHTPNYSETDLNGGGFGLSYAAMNATDTRSELGARFDDLTMVNGMPLILRARAAWAHDWVTNPALDATFQALPGASFIVNGAAPPQNSALITAAAELHVTTNWTLQAKFDGEFASGSQTYAGTGTVRYSW